MICNDDGCMHYDHEPLSPDEIDELPQAEFDALWIAERIVSCDDRSCEYFNDPEYSTYCECGNNLATD